jgi:hypothetical protein
MVDEKELLKQALVLVTSTRMAHSELHIAVTGLCTVHDKKIHRYSLNKLKKKSVLSYVLKRADFSIFLNISPSFLQECIKYNKEFEDIDNKHKVTYYSISILRDMLLNSEYKKAIPLFDRHVTDLKKVVPFLIDNLKFTVLNEIREQL